MATRCIQKVTAAIIAIFVVGGYLEASSHALTVIEKNPDRIYVEQSQIRLGQSGVAISVNGNAKRVPAVYKDTQGYYYETFGKTCPNHHSAVTLLGDCAIFGCPYYYDTPNCQL